MLKFFRRRNVFSYFGIQARLASVFLFWLLLLMAVYAFIFVVNYSAAAARTEGLQIHDQLVTRMLLINQTRDLAMYYGLATFGYVILVWAYILVYSHRLTGPIYKMNMVLKRAIAEQKWPNDLKFREGDAFMDLAETFNEFSRTMQKSSK